MLFREFTDRDDVIRLDQSYSWVPRLNCISKTEKKKKKCKRKKERQKDKSIHLDINSFSY